MPESNPSFNTFRLAVAQQQAASAFDELIPQDQRGLVELPGTMLIKNRSVQVITDKKKGGQDLTKILRVGMLVYFKKQNQIIKGSPYEVKAGTAGRFRVGKKLQVRRSGAELVHGYYDPREVNLDAMTVSFSQVLVFALKRSEVYCFLFLQLHQANELKLQENSGWNRAFSLLRSGKQHKWILQPPPPRKVNNA